LGTENSAGFGEAVFACGGLWCAVPPPDENLDEMLENQEFRRWGEGVEGGARFSSEVVRAEFDRASVICFAGSVWLSSTGGEGDGWGGGLGAGESWSELESDLGRAVAFLATLSECLKPN